jgi:methionyl-tRNA synthetase
MVIKEEGIRKEEHNGSLLESLQYDFWDSFDHAVKTYDFQKVVSVVNDLVKQLDTIISETKPWEKAKNGENIKPLLYQLAEGLRHIGLALLPIMPESAKKILASLGYSSEQIESFDLHLEKEWGRLEAGTKVIKGEMLFPRLQK